MIKFRTLRADEIEVKVKQVKANGLVALLYKTARTDMDLLDETVGAECWDCDYKTIKDNLYCGISIKTDDGWVTKWDCGIESREDDEGNQKKGEASDAFKRAGFKWGIGRELYTSPFIWIPSSACEIKEGKKCYDKFVVKSIEYSEDGKRITGIVVYNSSKGLTAYTWKEQNDKQEEEQRNKEARDKLIYVLQKKGIDLSQYAKEHNLSKDSTAEDYTKCLIELTKEEK